MILLQNDDDFQHSYVARGNVALKQDFSEAKCSWRVNIAHFSRLVVYIVDVKRCDGSAQVYGST